MQIESREELINAVMDAAELEHNLACLYLFAFFSLKKRIAEVDEVPDADIPVVFSQLTAWSNLLRKISLQEMGHLATVSNLLTLLGAEAHFDRPNFPPQPGYYPPSAQFVLERFSRSSLSRFVEFERNSTSPGVQALGLAPRGVSYKHVGELYAAIADAFQEIAAGGIKIPNERLFLGYKKPMDHAWLGSGVEVHDFGLMNAPPTDLADLRAKVREALLDVMEEGEGSPAPGEDSHYENFYKMVKDLDKLIAKYPRFDPARAVATNPMVQQHRAAAAGVTLITAQPTKDIAELFNSCYGTMVLALRQMYAFNEDLATRERRGQMHDVCKKIMTQTIAPLGSHLTELPLAVDSEERAGPGFELYRPMYVSSDKQIGWAIVSERLELASAECDRLIAEATLTANSTAILQRVKTELKTIKRITDQLQVETLSTPGTHPSI